MVALEKILEISNKAKKIKDRRVDDQEVLDYKKEKKPRGILLKNLRKIKSTFSPKVWDKVGDWITYGIKWLGI